MSSRRSRTAAKQRPAARDRRGNPPATGPERRSAPSPLVLASAATLGIAALPLLPRVHASLFLAGAFEAAALALAALVLVLRWRIRADGRTLHYRFAPSRVHWVQASMQGCVYAYWGWYWPEVYQHVPLIAGQILFVYALDMLVCWLRRDEWVLGFGPFPIVLSTNLFMWFRDDWFAIQLAMIAIGVLGKELIKLAA